MEKDNRIVDRGYETTCEISDAHIEFIDSWCRQNRSTPELIVAAALNLFIDKHKPAPHNNDIDPMTPEEFFLELETRGMSANDVRGGLTLWPPSVNTEGGGYQANYLGRVGFGDTVGIAVRAIFDHVTRQPSKRARLNPGFFEDEPPRRYDYDYRSEDYVP